MQKSGKTVKTLPKCPNLDEWTGWVILVCNAGEKPYVPSVFELNEYCRKKCFFKCPFYAGYS
jgi:hypothetical protein